MDESSFTGEVIPPSRPAGPMRIRNLAPRLPERGKIKAGIKGKEVTSSQGNKFQPPQKLDHFRVTTLERGSDGNFLLDEDFHERHGPNPTEIPVRLLYDDPDLNFPTRYACYLGRTLWCTGNGEAATRLSDSPPRNRAELEHMKPDPRQVRCPCHRVGAGYDGKDKCKPNGALSVLIDDARGLGGVWKFRTTSWNTITGLMGTLEFLATVTGGVLANIPLKMQIRPKQATNPIDGKPVLIYVVDLVFDGDTPQLQQRGHEIALERARTHVSIKHIEAEARRLLAAPGLNTVLPGDDADDVIDEFYHEQAHQPERPRREEYREQVQQQDEAETEPQPFIVVDLAGEFVELTDAAEAADRLREVQDEAEGQRGDLGIQAIWESNAQLIYELRVRRHHTIADAANAYYAERLANAEQHPHTGREKSPHPEGGTIPAFLHPLEPLIPTSAADNPNKASTPPIPPRGTPAPHAERDEKFWTPLLGTKPNEILYLTDELLRQCRDQTDIDGIEITNKDRFAKLESAADKKKIEEMIARRRGELAQ